MDRRREAQSSSPVVSVLASAASLQRHTHEAAEQRQQQQRQQQQRQQQQRGRFVDLLTDDLPFPDAGAYAEAFHHHHGHYRHTPTSTHAHPYAYASHGEPQPATRYRHAAGREQCSLELTNEAMSHFVPSRTPARRRHASASATTATQDASVSSSPDPGSGSSPDSAEEETKRPVPPAAAPSALQDAVDAAVTTPAQVQTSETTEKPKKRVRYLRDTDRRTIIKRIDNGEKQAALAREFGVTRAAICHIKKNRKEILARYNLLVKSAQEMDRAECFTMPLGVELMVHEVGSQAVLLLLTTLRDMRSSPAAFRRAAGRLIMILLEEALAVLGTQPVEVLTGTGHMCAGLERRDAFCSIAVGPEGYPFMVLFDQLEPHNVHGSIDVDVATDARGRQTWRLERMDLPADVTDYKLLLFSSTCATGGAMCKAIETLVSVGVAEANISLVLILCTADGLLAICDRFPRVKLIVAAIDGKVDAHAHTIVPGLGDFVSRYNGD